MNGLLLDTNVFYWLLTTPDRVRSEVRARVLDPDVSLFVSIAVPYEMAIKAAIGKLTLPMPEASFAEGFDEHLNLMAADLLPIQLTHLETYLSLPIHHRDPFDRIMIAQAVTDKLQLVSGDKAFRPYEGLDFCLT